MTRPASPQDPDEAFAELAALYAAGAMTPEECVDFERRLASGCAKTRDAWRQYRPVVAALADCLSPEDPNPAIKARLLAQVTANAPPHN